MPTKSMTRVILEERLVFLRDEVATLSTDIAELELVLANWPGQSTRKTPAKRKAAAKVSSEPETDDVATLSEFPSAPQVEGNKTGQTAAIRAMLRTTPKEGVTVAQVTDILLEAGYSSATRSGVSGVMTGLKEEGYLRHKKPFYFAVKRKS